MKTKTNSEAKATGYFHGDAMEYTGRTEDYAGGLFYEATLTEGHRKGQSIWTQREPRKVDTN